MLRVIRERIDAALESACMPRVDYALNKSLRPEFGDLSSNVALIVGKQAKKNPMQAAQVLVGFLSIGNPFFKVEVAPPGFLNIFCTPLLFSNVLGRWNNSAPKNKLKKKVNVELVSANPTGSLHLGHARNGAVGDSLARMFDYLGHEVEREYYVNDGGNQIDLLVDSVRLRCRELVTGQAAVIPEGGYHGTDIKRVAEEIVKENGGQVPSDDVVKKFAVHFLLGQIKKDLLEFGVTIDTWFSEASVYADGHKVINDVIAKLRKAGKVYEHEGATFLNTTADGDDKDRVIIKSDGTYSYLLPDIAYHAIKFAKHADLYVNVFGADHYSYITRLRSALRSLGFDDTKLHVVTIQLVRMIKDGVEYKMSKRSGTAVGLRDLVEAIGVDAARWYMVDKSTNTHTEIDVAKALAKDASNPVYYVQYAHARCNQLIANAPQDVVLPKSLTSEYVVKEASSLLSQMAFFDQTLNETTKAFEPHRITNYLYELAKIFHAYYAAYKIVDENDVPKSVERLAIVQALQKLMSQGLYLVGVSAPARM